MGRFSELNTNINLVSELFLSSQDLCKLLKYNDSNPLSKSDITDTSSLLFQNIYPIPKSIDATLEDKSFISFMFSNMKLNKANTRFKDEKLIINIVCHFNLWQIDGGIRPYAIAEAIDKLLNRLRNTKMTIGQVSFCEMFYREYSPHFAGYTLTYDLIDWN